MQEINQVFIRRSPFNVIINLCTNNADGFFSGPGAFLNTPLCQVALLEPRAMMFFGSDTGRRFSFGVPQWDFPTILIVSGIAAKRAPTPNANGDISSRKRLEISGFSIWTRVSHEQFSPNPPPVLVSRLEYILAGSWPNLNFELLFENSYSYE